jgi:hypothetical protein
MYSGDAGALILIGAMDNCFVSCLMIFSLDYNMDLIMLRLLFLYTHNRPMSYHHYLLDIYYDAEEFMRMQNHILTVLFISWSRVNVVGIATGYGLDDREFGVRVLAGSRIFSSPRRSDQFCGPPGLLSNGYRRVFPGGKAAGA